MVMTANAIAISTPSVNYTGYPNPGFWAPLGDAGAGAVNLTLAAGTGSATFTRATTAWTKLASGLWASVASGTARSCYLGADTAVGAYGGYFGEAAANQLVTPTASIRDMTNAAWVATTMTTALTSTGIDGTANSCTRLTATAPAATVLQTLVAAASSRTYSCFIKRITGTGSIVLMQGVTTLDVTSSVPNDGFFHRVQLNASVLNVAFGIQLATSGDAVDVDFNQFEAGAFASSPMASAGAARNADALSYPSSGNINTAAFTAYAEISPIAISSTAVIVSYDDGAFTSNSWTMLLNTSPVLRQQMEAASSLVLDNQTGTQVTSGIANKVVCKYSPSSTNQFIGGAASGGTSNPTGTPTGINTLRIAMRSNGLQLSYPMKNLKLFQSALTNAQIAGLG